MAIIYYFKVYPQVLGQATQDFQLNMLYFSFTTSLLNVALRTTQVYQERVRDPKNYIFAKEVKRFEDLTESEKDLIFYPKLSIMRLVDYAKPQEMSRIIKNPKLRCCINLSPYRVCFIFLFVLCQVFCFLAGIGMASVVYQLDDFGAIKQKDLYDENGERRHFALFFPLTYGAMISFLMGQFFIGLLLHSRFHVWKLIKREQGFTGKLRMFLAYYGLTIFDCMQLP